MASHSCTTGILLSIARQFVVSKIDDVALFHKPNNIKAIQMGQVSIVYENIIVAAWKGENYHKLQRLTRDLINSWPETDDDFPWINKSMFLVPDPDTGPMYRDQVIVLVLLTNRLNMNGAL